MRFIGDFHIHGRFAGACSKDITLDKLEEYARIKGINVLGVGDFTHPQWSKEIKETLNEDENGILWSKSNFPFIWQTEISIVYSQGGKGRRLHHLVLAPNGGVADQITEWLKKKGRVDYDGRPIFGMSSIQFVDELMCISKEIEVIPAHCMTPWFGLYGSKSGFDSLKECFEEKEKYIHAVETGISADPKMLAQFSHLKEKRFVSFSDNHSYWPWRLGREATFFDLKELSYANILKAIRTGIGFGGTIECPPSFGKYHFSGHRLCNVSFNPEETRKLKGICPVCKKELTIGVEDRVEELADTKATNIQSFIEVIPLTELITFLYKIKQPGSKKVWGVYNSLIKNFESEYKVLLEVSYGDLMKVVDEKLAKLILLNRQGKLELKPGYDGVYGEIVLEAEQMQPQKKKQKSLIDF